MLQNQFVIWCTTIDSIQTRYIFWDECNRRLCKCIVSTGRPSERRELVAWWRKIKQLHMYNTVQYYIYIQQYDAENSNTRHLAYDTVEGKERQLPFERRSSSAATTADQTCSSIPPWSVGWIVGNLDIYFDTYWWGFNILLAYTSFLLLCLQFLLHYSFLFALTTSFISKGALKSSLRVQSLQVNIYDKGPSEQNRILPGFCLDRLALGLQLYSSFGYHW